VSAKLVESQIQLTLVLSLLKMACFHKDGTLPSPTPDMCCGTLRHNAAPHGTGRTMLHYTAYIHVTYRSASGVNEP